tara:strand:+ start:1303 stop:1536 length:234 start_codon:yes stop_codon:yes gene_type:complete
MNRDELKTEVSNRLLELLIDIEDHFNVRIEFYNSDWEDIEERLTNHFIENEIISEEEQRINDLLNQADALSDDGRGK